MHVFQHPVRQRNEFLRNKKVLRTFYATAGAATALAASCGAQQANRNDFYFSAGGETQPIKAAITFNQRLRNGAVRCWKKNASRFVKALKNDHHALRWWWRWWYGSCCLRNLKANLAKATTRRWDDSQYALLNSSVFRRLRNWGTVSAGSRTAAGSQFHSTVTNVTGSQFWLLECI